MNASSRFPPLKTFRAPARLLAPLLAFLLSFVLPAAAQKYRTAVGLRLARPDLGITITQRLAERTTLEVLGSAANNDLTLNVLGRQHTGLLGHALNLYAGVGPHLGSTHHRGTYGGGTLALGIEWKIPIFPIVVAYDWMPSISTANREKRFNNSTGISIRYVLFKEKKDGIFKRLFKGKNKPSDRGDNQRTL